MSVSRPRPTEFPVTMPDQSFGRVPETPANRPKSYLWRKLFILVTSLALTIWTTREMYEVLTVSGLTILEWILLAIFAINISWVCYAFINATIGFLAALGTLRRAPAKPDPERLAHARTVICFPIYNEAVGEVFATVLSTARMLAGAPGHFECFILSDTTDPDTALREEAAFLRLRDQAPSDVAIRYRRRTINAHRKAGNIRDFVTRWGGRYDYMIVYDADSYMERGTILKLVDAMQAAPQTGLIQTIPQLVGARSLFAHHQQFASALYGPVLGHGIAWWAQKEGNFWGHNAIIRIEALAEAAGLPVMPGRAPFGGTILSHDFVEAALLRRAGWNVDIRPDLEGSYEQGPPTIVDLVIRDRRWCQGNMQHMAVLLKTRGLTWTSRFHLITGIFSYLASPFWLLFITIGMFLSLQNSFLTPTYFGDGASLFPSWPVIDSERALKLFVVTMTILFAPKIYGLLYGFASKHWRRTVGLWRTFVGVISETALSILIAPILMATQTGAVISVLLGRDAGWSPQQRAEGGYTFVATLRHNAPATLLGIVLTVSAVAISPVFAAWLAPATVGLILSAPITWWTGLRSAGDSARKAGILVTPSDLDAPPSFQTSQDARGNFRTVHPPQLSGLLMDREAQARREFLVDPYWPLDRYEVYEPLALARARAERATSVRDYLGALTTKEKMALLNSCADLRALSIRFTPLRKASTRTRKPGSEMRQPDRAGKWKAGE
ncbi:glucans biosynthesis glucosyltransferase MdoH [Henriciella aquimarina]|uniref:glucans biosynthesis glucosyltransferase MdoH n=1 Tax=Henriciella aquimarina TaxID=545261 RepID=UPI000A01B94A|nr:glucans biosynthesis glucosyltransferase MdoH [Henriciella aquimarina]